MPDVGRFLARVNWPGLCTIALGFLLWELLLRAGLAHYQNLPPPSAIAGGLLEITRNGRLLADAPPPPPRDRRRAPRDHAQRPAPGRCAAHAARRPGRLGGGPRHRRRVGALSG